MEQPTRHPAPPPAKDKRPLGEIYDAVVENIRAMYDHQLTDKEAHEAARNLLGFCQKVIQIRSRES